MPRTYLAHRDCVIAGHPGIVRAGDRIELHPRRAKYALIKGWLEPAPPEVPAPAPTRTRSRRRAA